jgi:Ca-activated chloride channel family protein
MSLSRILMPILIVILVFGMLSTLNGDQKTGMLKGTITDKESGQPVKNAMVAIAGSDLKTRTNADGSFLIKDIPSGLYEITVTATGYHELHMIRAEILFNHASILEYALSPVKDGDTPKVEAIFGFDLPQELLGLGAIKGMIIDKKEGKPIAGAVVYLKGTRIGAQTDSKGEYIIKNIPVNTYTLQINIVRFKSLVIENVDVIADKTLELNAQLDEADLNYDDSPIIENGEEVTLDEIQNLRIISAEEIENMPVQDVDQILALQVGVVERGKEIHIRGGRIGDRSYTVDGVETSDPLGAQKIKSGFDAEYGSALSGVVNCPSPSGQWLPHGGTTPPNSEPYSGTFFKHYGTNPFVDTEDDHLSTFAIDVDDASYSVMRGYIAKGHLPKPEAVRVEEFVNFFNYDYRAPQSERFKVYIEGAPSKFGQNCDIIRVGIKGQEVNPKHRKPAVLTFVIDVSGSMAIDSRLGLVKKALKILVDNLNPDDRVGIAVYASRGQKILDHTSIKDKDKILYAIESLRTSGSTYAEEGLKIGYQMASENFKKGAINRIILCSDGVANVGRTGADEILREIRKYVEQGITLTTVGFGMDNYNDILMEKLGDKGNGHFSYVDNLEQAKRIFMQNLTGTLQVIARDVKIQVDFDPDKVRSYRLLGYENRDVEDDKFRDDKEDGGEIGSGHDVTALYEVKFKDGASGKFATVYMRYKDPDFVDEVTEVNFPINRNDLRVEFSEATNSFKLAVCAAEFAEILRESFYSKDANFADLLDLAQELSGEMKGNDDVIEFTALISRAKKLWDEKELLSSED